MRQKSGPVKESAEKVVKDIRRATRRHFSAENKIRIVLPTGRLLGGVGSEDGARPAESFGYDRRQGQSAIETLAVELTEPLARLLPVPNDHDRLNGIDAPCTSPGE